MGRRLSDDEVKNLNAGRPLDAPQPDPNAPAAAPPADPSLGSDIWSSVGAGAESFGKSFVTHGLGAKATGKGLFPGVGKAVMDWAGSKDEAHPIAEKVGQETEKVAEYLPLAAMPEMGVGAGMGRLGLLLKHPKVAKAIADVLESGWQGSLGGALENPKRPEAGAQTGGTIAAGSSVGRNLARGVMDFAPSPIRKAGEAIGSLAGGGAGIAGITGLEHLTGGRGVTGQHLIGWHLMPTLSALAAALAGYPGIVGGASEKAAQQAGYDQPPQQ